MATVVGLAIVDKIGRRPILIEASIQVLLCPALSLPCPCLAPLPAPILQLSLPCLVLLCSALLCHLPCSAPASPPPPFSRPRPAATLLLCSCLPPPSPAHRRWPEARQGTCLMLLASHTQLALFNFCGAAERVLLHTACLPHHCVLSTGSLQPFVRLPWSSCAGLLVPDCPSRPAGICCIRHTDRDEPQCCCCSHCTGESGMPDSCVHLPDSCVHFPDSCLAQRTACTYLGRQPGRLRTHSWPVLLCHVHAMHGGILAPAVPALCMPGLPWAEPAALQDQTRQSRISKALYLYVLMAALAASAELPCAWLAMFLSHPYSCHEHMLSAIVITWAWTLCIHASKYHLWDSISIHCKTGAQQLCL